MSTPTKRNLCARPTLPEPLRRPISSDRSEPTPPSPRVGRPGLHQLARIGVKLNQLSLLAHAGGLPELEAELRATMDEVRGAIRALQ